MKATGIVRRIDDLGRIVIPKEIRQSWGIKEGDPLELFIDQDKDCVCFRRYMPFVEPWRMVQETADALKAAECYEYASQLNDIANKMKKEKRD